jgi:hypothetical protein
MNNYITNFKIHIYVSYECATSSGGYSKVLILLKLRNIFKTKLEFCHSSGIKSSRLLHLYILLLLKYLVICLAYVNNVTIEIIYHVLCDHILIGIL